MIIGWLDTYGTFYRCHYEEHEALAIDFIQDLGDELNFSDALIKQGWVKLTVSLFGRKKQRIIWDNRFLTDAQKSFLDKMLDDDDNFPVDEIEYDLVMEQLEK